MHTHLLYACMCRWVHTHPCVHTCMYTFICVRYLTVAVAAWNNSCYGNKNDQTDVLFGVCYELSTHFNYFTYVIGQVHNINTFEASFHKNNFYKWGWYGYIKWVLGCYEQSMLIVTDKWPQFCVHTSMKYKTLYIWVQLHGQPKICCCQQVTVVLCLWGHGDIHVVVSRQPRLAATNGMPPFYVDKCSQVHIC